MDFSLKLIKFNLTILLVYYFFIRPKYSPWFQCK